jgi:hypothetical protein
MIMNNEDSIFSIFFSGFCQRHPTLVFAPIASEGEKGSWEPGIASIFVSGRKIDRLI